MDLKISEKIALVSGSSRGLGLSIAQTLHAEGCHVIINGRDVSSLKKQASILGERVTIIQGDVTDTTTCKQMLAEIESSFSRLDILVCNVGSGTSVPPGEETPDEWRRVIDLNLTSATNMVETSRHLLSKQGGSVVCISSICGQEVLGAPLTYSAAKAALNSYVRGIARPLALENIRINAVAPGNLLYEGSVWEQKLAEDASAVQAMLNREVALRRLGKPEEIADFVAFLVSPRSAFSTGAVFIVDGGQIRS
jgi:3-oxoacyl-[acyl-carrier protein] reductase|tara:strand:- start:1326 stop:2081 length:756 start_codon:yes stop_codon:yes gene_type:complete